MVKTIISTENKMQDLLRYFKPKYRLYDRKAFDVYMTNKTRIGRNVYLLNESGQITVKKYSSLDEAKYNYANI